MDDGIIKRTTAASGKLDIATTQVLRATGQTHLEVLPMFVERTQGTDCSLKLSYWKKMNGNFRVGYPAEFTLNHVEILRLQEVIGRVLAVSGTGGPGEYVTIQLDNASATDLNGKNLPNVGSALVGVLMHDDILSAMLQIPDSAALLRSMQAAIQLESMRAGVAELEELLRTETLEQRYQDWCTANSWAFGSAYLTADSVRAITVGDSVDGLLPATANAFRDIFELKRPDMLAVAYDKTHKSYYWSRDTSIAIGQCHRYLDALHEEAASGLRDHSELVAYHPQAIIVIGRSDGWSDGMVRAFHGLNARLHGMKIVTYDHLLAQARRSVDLVTKTSNDENFRE